MIKPVCVASFVLSLAVVAVRSQGDPHHNGNPPGISNTFDCASRKAAYEYGIKLLPQRGTFRTLFEALQLQFCDGMTTPTEMDTFTVPTFPTKDDAIFVDASAGSDTNQGTKASPFKTIAAAVSHAKANGQIVLRKGTYYTGTVDITTDHNGLTIQNYNGEDAVVSGGVPFSVAKSSWKQYKGNTWVADVPDVTEIAGLRMMGLRMIRAKYPNGNMEESGNWLQGAGASMGGGEYVKGWVTDKTDWVPPYARDHGEDIIANNTDWPSVEWPAYTGSQTGEGDKGDFHIGVGGYCQTDLQDPIVGPTGYWCAIAPPRGQCWDPTTNKGRGCTQTHMRPDGVVWARAANYSDPTTANVLAWRGGGRWFSQMWKVESYTAANTTLMFDPTTGGQGGEGMTSASEWWIENVLEECDDGNEFFFDEKKKQLYFNFNNTKPTGTEDWVATKTRVLFNISGTMAAPVKDVTIRGLTMRDARLTYLDPHGMPSGGDWGLQRSGVVLMQGTERITVDSNQFTRNDGNGVFLSMYNRNTTISNNDVSWNGDTVFAAWGITGKCVNEKCDKKLDWPVGPDGRNGEQPRGTQVIGNLVREIGIWQKQSSMWFQAVTAETHVKGNVHFNGPRAGLNFNDGFGGGDIIENNLITNCVRESGDHGPYNSWDRIPYITTIRTGKPSVIPQWRTIRHNFIISVYSSQEAIDTDDGSAYYKTYENFFVYAANGLKSDFAGHSNRHYGNVYGYVGNCWGDGDSNWFVNNTCITQESAGGFRSDCQSSTQLLHSHPQPNGMKITGNSIYTASGTLGNTKLCDKSNTVHKLPTDDEVIAMGKKVIGWV